jgi:hypothetical protein
MTLSSLKKRPGINLDFRQLIGIGQACLIATIFLGRMELAWGWADFVEGMLLGISTVTNLTGLYLFGRGEQEKGNNHGKN